MTGLFLEIGAGGLVVSEGKCEVGLRRLSRGDGRKGGD